MERFKAETAACSWGHAAACTSKGFKPSNENAHLIQTTWTGFDAASPVQELAGIFAVCDGHGGSSVSRKVVERIGLELHYSVREVASESLSTEACKKATEDAFCAMDTWLRRDHLRDSLVCGSTCVAAMVWPSCGAPAAASDANRQQGPDSGERSRSRSRPPRAGTSQELTYRVVLANLGDSRALLCRDGAVLTETADHRPSQPIEEERIRAAGGKVSKPTDATPARIDGVLPVARGFGDFFMKRDTSRMPGEQKVSSLPDVYEMKALPGDIIILACDAVFSVMTSAQVAALAFETLRCCGKSDMGTLAETLVRRSLVLKTRENVTCVVVYLGQTRASLAEFGPAGSVQPVIMKRPAAPPKAKGAGGGAATDAAAAVISSDDE